MTDWKHQYPSVTLSKKHDGDLVYSDLFRGEANKLLYELKNLMKFRNLGQLKMTRFFTDGTVITARSVFGQDFVNIDVSRSVVGILEGIPTCSITLFNLPESVPPMKWYKDGIHEGEVEGIDYIKTYYRYENQYCTSCPQEPDFNVCSSGELPATYGWTAIQTCIPFFYHNLIVPVREGEDDNHCIHGHCQAEIIRFGSDSGGSYFLWKAYTEWSTFGPTFADFTQRGLGYLLLRAFIRIETEEVCASESSIIKVDCCLKPLSDRIPVIWWEKCIGGGWCVAPSEGSIEQDLEYFWQYGGWINMYLSLRGNWCLPATWVLTGIGELTVSEDGDAAGYKVPFGDLLNWLGDDCHGSKSISIKGIDRCGTDDIIIFTSTPCCDIAEGLEIGYTSLIMSCSGSQTLTAQGGCAPYNWSLSGGEGTLTPSDDTKTALYEAPDTNVNCSSNPTINLSDCCGGSNSIKIAVNCNTGNEVAYKVFAARHTGDVSTCSYTCNMGDTGCMYDVFWYAYRCDGTYIGEIGEEGGLYIPCTDGIGSGCPSPCSAFPGNLKSTWFSPPCPVHNIPWGCGEIVDLRTEEMKAGGCCPINPSTGLPF
jgi:hypothetical protein